MKKKKTPEKYKLVPFDEILAKQMKGPTFRKKYFEELNRLRLVHEIKQLRQKKHMTQEEVAAKAKMPQSVIARLESGKHRFSLVSLQKIARVFEKHVGLVK